MESASCIRYHRAYDRQSDVRILKLKLPGTKLEMVQNHWKPGICCDGYQWLNSSVNVVRLSETGVKRLVLQSLWRKKVWCPVPLRH